MHLHTVVVSSLAPIFFYAPICSLVVDTDSGYYALEERELDFVTVARSQHSTAACTVVL